jgi:hypothetical protein
MTPMSPIEMLAAVATWQIAEFGCAYHAFADPEAATPDTNRDYDAMAGGISWAGTLALLGAVLKGETRPLAG